MAEASNLRSGQTYNIYSIKELPNPLIISSEMNIPEQFTRLMSTFATYGVLWKLYRSPINARNALCRSSDLEDLWSFIKDQGIDFEIIASFEYLLLLYKTMKGLV